MNPLTAPALPAPHVFGQLLREGRSAQRRSQLQLALHAGVSQRHLSFLESGRAQPSREMVQQLAQSLELPLAEHNRWLHAAGYAPAYTQRPLAAQDMAPVRAALALMLQQQPWPVIVVDRAWNLIQHNAAWARLLGLLGDSDVLWQRVCGSGPRNVFMLTFHPQGFRPLIRNFATLAPPLLARTAREAQSHPGVRAVLNTVLAYPEIPRHWQKPDLTLQSLPVLPTELQLGEVCLRLFTVLATFGTPQDLTTDELRVESFFPADEASTVLLTALLK